MMAVLAGLLCLRRRRCGVADKSPTCPTGLTGRTDDEKKEQDRVLMQCEVEREWRA